MDLIAQVVAAVLSFLASVIGNIFAHDICATADSVCAKIIKAAALRLASFNQTSTEHEWLVDLHEHRTVFQKYRHAIGCYLVAPKMRRCALEAPSVEGAPGLVWKRRRDDIWEGRWQASLNAIQEGYVVKSVKLISVCGNCLTAEDKDFIIDVARELQAELAQWLSDRATMANPKSEKVTELPEQL
jgi:hypothetical protein